MLRRARRRGVLAGLLLLLGAAACRTTPPSSPTVAVSASLTPTHGATSTVTPWLLVDAEASDAVQQAVLAWAVAAGVQAQPRSLADPVGDLTPGLEQAIVLEDHLAGLQQAWPVPDLEIIVLDASSTAPAETISTLGPVIAYDEAGFLAGTAAGLATASGVVGILPGSTADSTAAFRSGFAEGLLYACPRCQLEGVSDPGQPSYAMDVIAVPPATELPEAGPGPAVPWLVVFGDPPAAEWAARVAARVRTAPEAIVVPALVRLSEGELGEGWPFSAVNGGLYTEIDHQAISPGRERLLREAEARLASGLLAVGGGED